MKAKETEMRLIINLKQIIFAVVLTVSAVPVMAGWMKYSESDESDQYIDLSSIRKSGDLRKVWQMWDYRIRGKYGQSSQTLRTEFNCKDETTRLLVVNGYEEPLANGKVLSSVTHNNDQWFDIPPDTAGARALELVCAKK